jgi:CubicO group peptidase (beta-lactamase class C family)
VSRGNEVLFKQAYGYQDFKAKKTNTVASIFQIGSLTKSFTSMIILKLAEQNKLAINDTLGKYFPEFKYGGQITIEQLLKHTSGVYDSFKKPQPEVRYSTKAYDSRDLTKDVFSHPLMFTPGSRFAYSNSGYTLLGLIIEKVTNLSYEKAVADYVFKPADMENSGYNFQILRSGSKTTNYSYWSDTKHIEEPVWNPGETYAAGALYSNVSDLFQWYKAIRNNKIISAESFKKATNQSSAYGYGWFLDSLYKRRTVNHGGNIEGATSYFLMSPEDDICIILLNNTTNTKLERIGNSILALLLNKPYSLPQPKKSIQLDPQLLTNYVGKYEISEGNFAFITKEKDLLYIKEGEDKMRLFAEKPNSFFVPGEDMELSFIPATGVAKQLRIRKGLSTKVGDKVE